MGIWRARLGMTYQPSRARKKPLDTAIPSRYVTSMFRWIASLLSAPVIRRLSDGWKEGWLDRLATLYA